MTFQKNLKKYRELSRYTAKELSIMLGIPYATYVSYENRGREPKYPLLCQIAKLLHTTPNDLLGFTLDKEQQAIQFLQACGLCVSVRTQLERDGTTSTFYDISQRPPDELTGRDLIAGAFYVSVTPPMLLKYVQQIQESPAYKEQQRAYVMEFLTNEKERNKLCWYLKSLIKNGLQNKELESYLHALEHASNSDVPAIHKNIVDLLMNALEQKTAPPNTSPNTSDSVSIFHGNVGITKKGPVVYKTDKPQK